MKDSSFEQLKKVAEGWFQKACECKKEDKTLSGVSDYSRAIEEVVGFLEDVDEANAQVAREMISEIMKDIDYCYGLSKSESKRLSKV